MSEDVGTGAGYTVDAGDNGALQGAAKRYRYLWTSSAYQTTP
jgi:hypothetical protein